VDEGAVRRIHQPDDAVINADRHFSLQVSELVVARELLDFGGRIGRFGRWSETSARRPGIRNVDPDEVILLFARIAAGVNAIDFELLIRGQGRDQLALTVMNVELPAVISAFQVFSIEMAAVERHTTVRAGIAQCEWLPHSIASNHQRDFQQRRLVKLIAVHSIGGERSVPEAGKHERVRGLALRKIKFGHGEFVDCCLLSIESRAYASIRMAWARK